MSRGRILGVMLFVPAKILALDEELSCGNGIWSRSELLEMDARFCEALERAFANGTESRAAARATVRIGSLRNGKGAVIESAIQAAWDLVCSKKGEMAASEVLAFVRELVPGVPPERVRAEFKRRRFSWIGEAR